MPSTGLSDMPPPAETFSKRIQKRYQLWWGPIQSYGIGGWKQRLHRRKERFIYRDKSDPQSAWHCCAFWQRSLANKWNAWQFVQGYGCRVSKLYWSGRWIASLPFASLPDNYVIRPYYGHSRRNVLAIASAVDLLGGTSYSAAELRQHLIKTLGRFSRVPVLVHEFVRTESGEYTVPIEYQCHVGETVGAVQVIERQVGGGPTRNRFYSPAWEPFSDKMRARLPFGQYMDPPRCLDDILNTVRTLGKTYGTYVRIDGFATDRGCVFGEFTPTPARGANFTPYADEYLGALWEEHLGDTV
jgi:hypothetical protein